MGRKLRLCSRKYRDWKPKKMLSAKRLHNIDRDKDKTKSLEKVVSPPASPVTPLLYDTIKRSLPIGWFDHSSPDQSSIRVCKIVNSPSSSAQPLIITHSIIVEPDFSWKVFVHNCEAKSCSALSGIPLHLDDASIPVNILHACLGHFDSQVFGFC